MPTKKEIQTYLEESRTHSMYTASVKFDIAIEDVYKIYEGKVENIQVELVGCSNPKPEAEICKKCIRNQISADYDSFSIIKPMMSIGYKCDGYINKATPPYSTLARNSAF